jgi:hypothetical protein
MATDPRTALPLPPAHVAVVDAALDELARFLLLARLRGLSQAAAGPEPHSGSPEDSS